MFGKFALQTATKSLVSKFLRRPQLLLAKFSSNKNPKEKAKPEELTLTDLLGSEHVGQS